MKKFILSFLVGTFVFYSFFQHSSPAVTVPANKTPTTSLVPTAEAPSRTTASVAKPVSKPTSNPATQPIAVSGQYKDGSYIGPSVDAYYGNVQVKAVVSGGKLTDVQFLDYPQDRSTSRMINNMAMPYLISEAIQKQSANVDIISGATDSSGAFIQSLGTALAQAQ